MQQVAVTQTAFEDAPVAVQADDGCGISRPPITARLVDREGAPCRADGGRATARRSRFVSS